MTSTPYWDPNHPEWSDGSYSVMLGGSWADDPAYCRFASRSGVRPAERGSFVGLRLAAE